jgi:mRNA interferase MazF
VRREREPGWGEAWWLELEAIGRRPVVVLSRPEAIPHLLRVLVAPATTHVRGLPTEVSLDVDDGLPRPCVLTLDTIELASKVLLVDYISTLSASRMHAVCTAAGMALNCR